MKKFLIHFSVLFLLLGISLASFITWGALGPAAYANSFYAGLVKKDNRLENIKGRKIVFLGGSSLSFGLRSDLLSRALGVEVVDYGLYAPLGTKTMAELAKPMIGANDVVVFAPEISEETYSPKMDLGMLWKCIETKGSMLNRIDFDAKMEAFYRFPGFSVERRLANVQPVAPYDLSSFNEYGDIQSDLVVENILPAFYDDSQMIAPSTKLLRKDFLDYLNGYAKDIEKRGAKTYFTFSPSNVLALVKEGLPSFESGLAKGLSFPVLGNVESFTYHQNYFYDTNYHLNYAGTVIHSKGLAAELAKALAIQDDESVFPEVEMPRARYEEDPEPTPEPTPEPEPGPTPVEQPFTLKLLGGSYFLVGVDGSWKEKKVIWVPKTIDGHEVFGVDTNAFADFTNLEVVIFPDSVQSFSNGIFANCPALKRIYLTNLTAPMSVASGFLTGCPSARIYILKSARNSYMTGYTWSVYKAKFVTYNIEDLDVYKDQALFVE